MKSIKKLTETALSFFVVGIISVTLGFNFHSTNYSAEYYSVNRDLTPNYGFVGLGVVLVLTAIVILIVVMDKLSSNSHPHNPKKRFDL